MDKDKTEPRTCTEMRHATQGAAFRQLTTLRKANPAGSLQVRRCDICGYWHVRQLPDV